MVRIAAAFVLVKAIEAASCTSDEQATIVGMDANDLGKKANDCGTGAYNVLTGAFNHDKFNECFIGKVSISSTCSECYAATGEYGAKNCKSSCLLGWCKQGCLDCTAPAQETLATCVGAQPKTATPCLSETVASCSGTADPAGPACYEGSAGALGLTETVKVNLLEVQEGAGKLEFTGSGIEGFTCSDKTYTKSGSDVALSDLSDCLPSGVEVTKTQYCSDDDTMKVTVKDTSVPLPVTATLKNVPCAGREVFATCTGDADPVITETTCYKGSAGALGLTETVTVKVKDFAAGAGHIDFFGDGIEAFTCTEKTFTKSGQDITFSDSSDCLPSGIVVSGVKYCSDSDTMKITVKDTSVPLPISAIMSKIDCPASIEV